jgi:hypothetical protein
MLHLHSPPRSTRPMTENAEKPTYRTVPREIVITNRTLEYGNIEAWTSIIASYRQRHPDHEVLILYEGEPVNSMLSLYKRHDKLNLNGFQLAVSAPDADWKDVPKLYRYLVEGASPAYRKFIEKEMFRVLDLF